MDQVRWPDPALTPDQYKQSYLAALYRMSALLNSGTKRSPITPKHLLLTDQDLAAQFGKDKAFSDTVRFRVTHGDPNESPREKAEDHFYGQFTFKGHRTSATDSGEPLELLRVTHIATDTFLDWSCRKLHKPNGEENVLRSGEFGTPLGFASHCATNYALKNFWHNFVHERLQGISHHNYHAFAGDARFETDFEADNLANILLLLAYGIEVRTLGKTNPRLAARTRTIFARNVCNRVFEERADQRISPSTPVSDRDKWSEFEWRVRRRISNAISQRLAEDGMTATSLGIYFGGRVKTGRRGFYRSNDSTVCVCINGLWIDTGIAPYVPSDIFDKDTFGVPLAPGRKEASKAFQNKRQLEIVMSATTLYRKHLMASVQFRNWTAARFSKFLQRLQIG
jgi:hypothetical protein